MKKIEVTELRMNELKSFEARILLAFRSILTIYTDLKFEEVEVVRKTKILRKTVTEKKYFLTNIVIHGWNQKGKFWGIFEDDESIAHWLMTVDISTSRQDFIEKIKEPLEALGVKMKIDIKPDNKVENEQ